MKKVLSKALVLSLAVLFVLTALVGCGTPASSAPPAATSTGGNAASTPEAGGPDISEKVELKVFAIADQPKSQEMSEEYFPVLNEMLTEKLNATVKYEYASGNNYQNNYQLVMSSGDQYDLIHAAAWLNYAENAKKGAFMDLTELMPEYAPDYYARVNSNGRLAACMVDGKVYGIPNSRTEYAEPSFFYREDLRKKYNVPEINSLDDIGVYLQAIKDNEPDLLPSDDYQAQVYGTTFITTNKYQIVDEGADRHSNFVIDPENPREVLITYEVPEYLPHMERMKEWADAGYWPKSVLNVTDWGVFSVTNGKAAASFNGQFFNYAYLVPQTEQENEGWEMNYVPYVSMEDGGILPERDPTGAMVAVTRTAQNPERALMFIELAHKDEELFRLTNYGIEGVHYADVDGTRDESILGDPLVEKFNYFPGGTFFDDENFYMPYSNQWDKQEELTEKMLAKNVPNVLSGFVLDFGPIEAEYTAVNQVRIEFGFPLQAGLVDDVQASYDTLLQKLQDAGIEKCRAEIESQLNAFLDSKGA